DQQVVESQRRHPRREPGLAGPERSADQGQGQLGRQHRGRHQEPAAAQRPDQEDRRRPAGGDRQERRLCRGDQQNQRRVRQATAEAAEGCRRGRGQQEEPRGPGEDVLHRRDRDPRGAQPAQQGQRYRPRSGRTGLRVRRHGPGSGRRAPPGRGARRRAGADAGRGGERGQRRGADDGHQLQRPTGRRARPGGHRLPGEVRPEQRRRQRATRYHRQDGLKGAVTVHRYSCWNGAMPTTAALASISTGTTIKTMLQIATPSTRQIVVLAWGFTLDDPPGADAVFELIETDVAATVTAHVAAGVQPVNSGMPASLMTLGTSATGYTSSAEGSVTTTRTLDIVAMSSVSAEAAPFLTYEKEFPDYRLTTVSVSKFLRVRATTPTSAVDMRCWIAWDE